MLRLKVCNIIRFHFYDDSRVEKFKYCSNEYVQRYCEDYYCRDEVRDTAELDTLEKRHNHQVLKDKDEDILNTPKRLKDGMTHRKKTKVKERNDIFTKRL